MQGSRLSTAFMGPSLAKLHFMQTSQMASPATSPRKLRLAGHMAALERHPYELATSPATCLALTSLHSISL
jgi:hypothetical protein